MEHPSTAEAPKPAAFDLLVRVPTILIVLLTVCTLGFYVPYWLYTRSRILNLICPQKPIPSWFIALCMGGFVMILVMVFQLPEGTDLEQLRQSPDFARFLQAAMLLNSIILLWGILFLQRINIVSGSTPEQDTYGNYFYLILSHLLIVNIFYLQYKINQILDSRRSSIGLM